MSSKKRMLTVTAAGLFMAGFSVGPVFADEVDEPTPEAPEATHEVTEEAPETVEILPLTPVVEDVSDEQLIEAAINGMLTSLDPHSSYLNQKNFSDMKVQTRGEFGGLGIEVTMENGLVKVVSPIDDTPAAKAGLIEPRDMAAPSTPVAGTPFFKIDHAS